MHQGHCLCGKVKITLDDTYTSQIACHCVSCQRWSGSAFGCVVSAHEDKVKIEGEIKKYDYVGFNKDRVSRWHCPTCGSCIGHHTSMQEPGYVAIQTGNFDDFHDIPFSTEANLQMKWSVLPPIPGATQYQTTGKQEGKPAEKGGLV